MLVIPIHVAAPRLAVKLRFGEGGKTLRPLHRQIRCRRRDVMPKGAARRRCRRPTGAGQVGGQRLTWADAAGAEERLFARKSAVDELIDHDEIAVPCSSRNDPQAETLMTSERQPLERSIIGAVGGDR